MTDFIFVGKGDGVPGLSHEISKEQAEILEKDYQESKAAGLTEVQLAALPWVQLQAGLKNGNYEAKKPVKSAVKAEKKPEEEQESEK